MHFEFYTVVCFFGRYCLYSFHYASQRASSCSKNIVPEPFKTCPDQTQRDKHLQNAVMAYVPVGPNWYQISIARNTQGRLPMHHA